MQARLRIQQVAPQAFRAMAELESYVRNSRLEPALLEFDMHTKDALANDESDQRLYALAAWRETPFFSDRERAALAWTEAVTLISRNHAPDGVCEEARRRFTEQELVDLTMAIVAINGRNRLAIGFRTVPGTYQPKAARS